MKLFICLLLFISFIGCGESSKDPKQITLTEGVVSSCTVSRDEELSQVVISCPDGTQEVINDGEDGQDGQSCMVEDKPGGAMITCGETQAFIKDGTNGEDGSACSVAQDEHGSGALISCGDGTSAFIQNGEDGEDGLDFVAEIIDPCGTETTHGMDEVLLVLHSGDILAHYSDKKLNYLTILQKGKKY